jgi:hypothetical protein
MTRVRRLRLLVLAGLISLLPAAAVPAAEPARPGDPSARVLAEVVLPDLRATLGHLEATMAAVAPGTLPPGALTAMAGARFKDPGLSGLGAGPVVVMVVAPEGAAGTPGAVLFLPVKDPKAYQDATAAMGLTSSSARGLLIAASDARALPAARALESRYRAIGAEKASASLDLRLRINAPRLMELYGPLLRLGASSMIEKMSQAPAAGTGKAPPAFVASILRLELLGVLALLEQIEEARVDLAFLPDSVASETVLAARPGTALADLAQAPPPGPNRAAAIVAGTGTMAGWYRFDGARFSTFVLGILREAPADPGLAAILTPEVLELIREAGAVYTGEGAMSADFRPGAGGTPEMKVQAVAGVADEGRALAMLERTYAFVSPLMESIVESGQEVKFALEKNVRQTGGVPVHRVRLTPPKSTAKGKPAKGAKPAKAAPKPTTPSALPFNAFDVEFAFAHGYYLSASDAAGLDRLVARAATASEGAPTLQAEKAFGPGRQGYMDYDFLSVLKSMPVPEGQPNPFAALAEVEPAPLLYAFSMDGGKFSFEQRLPLKPLAGMMAAIKKAEALKPAKPQPETP